MPEDQQIDAWISSINCAWKWHKLFIFMIQSNGEYLEIEVLIENHSIAIFFQAMFEEDRVGDVKIYNVKQDCCYDQLDGATVSVYTEDMDEV